MEQPTVYTNRKAFCFRVLKIAGYIWVKVLSRARVVVLRRTGITAVLCVVTTGFSWTDLLQQFKVINDEVNTPGMK